MGTTEQVGLALVMIAVVAILTGFFALVGRLGDSRRRRAAEAAIDANRSDLPPESLPRAPAPTPAPIPVAPPAPRGAPIPTTGAIDWLQRVPNLLDPPSVPESSDPGLRTRQCESRLPAVALMDRPALTPAQIPVLYDGRAWVSLDLTGQQHWRICGTSGSGKGTTLMLIALSALALGPEAVEVWLLDPKDGMDYRQIAMGVRHARLFADQYQASLEGEILRDSANRPVPLFDGSLTEGYTAAVRAMRQRNRVIGDSGFVNHRDYNAHVAPDRRLPTLLLICDEVSELTSEQREALSTLARMGRSAGIVLCVATQYPTADTLPSQVQANLHHALTFRFNSPKYSAVAMGVLPGVRTRYEPSAIQARGVAVHRHEDAETLGRVPDVPHAMRAQIARELAARWPRAESTPELPAERVAVVPAPMPQPAPMPAGADVLLEALLAEPYPESWSPRHKQLAIYLFAQLVRGRQLGPEDLSTREIASWLYPKAAEHGGGGGYSRMAADAICKVLPTVNQWLSTVNLAPVNLPGLPADSGDAATSHDEFTAVLHA